MTSTRIAVKAIERDEKQPRTVFAEEALHELADSLKERGQIQPITVRRKPIPGPDRYVIVTGERRWRAAQIAGLTHLEAVVVRARKDRLVDQIAENVLRADMSPLETAKAYRRAIDELGITPGELAKRLGLRQSFRVNESLSLLKLCEEAQDLLERQVISRMQAWALTGIDHEKQRRVLELHQAGKLPTEAAFTAACQAPTKTVSDQALLCEVERQSAATRELLKGIEQAGMLLSASLIEPERWMETISVNDAKQAAQQLAMLSKTVRELQKKAEATIGISAMKDK